jgi:peptidoglycan-associated lipoprotein
MLRSTISYRTLILAGGLCLLAGCADMTPPPARAAAMDGPQLAGAWYQVFFDSNGSEINARGQMIIKTVADVVKQDGKVRVSVVGKTDRVGSSAANGSLSQRRADRVRDALIAQAVPANRIDTSWTGEAKQDVATSDNVAEQRNRVVDIAVQHPY